MIRFIARTLWIAVVSAILILVYHIGTDIDPIDQNIAGLRCLLAYQVEASERKGRKTVGGEIREVGVTKFFTDFRVYARIYFNDKSENRIYCHWEGKTLLYLRAGDDVIKAY